MWRHSQTSFYYNPGHCGSEHGNDPSSFAIMENRMWLNHKPRVLYIWGWSQNSVIGIVTRLSARYFGVQIPVGARRFFSSPVRTDRLPGPAILLLSRNRNSLLMVNRPELDVGLLPSSSSEVKNEELYIYSPLRFIIKPTKCINFPKLFRHETLHVSDSSSAHHQEFIHCTLSTGICHTGLKTAFEQDYPGPARKPSTNLYDIYQCRVYSE